MKNSQKGFAVPLLIAIIAVLVVGGGIYVYEQNKSQQPVVNDQTVSTAPISASQTTSSQSTITPPVSQQVTNQVKNTASSLLTNPTALNCGKILTSDASLENNIQLVCFGKAIDQCKPTIVQTTDASGALSSTYAIGPINSQCAISKRTAQGDFVSCPSVSTMYAGFRQESATANLSSSNEPGKYGLLILSSVGPYALSSKTCDVEPKLNPPGK